jgi:hypothetical protein
MWFIRLFVWAVGLALLYMLLTQQTPPMLVHGEQRVYSLVHHPIRFVLTFAMFAVFEWFLIVTLRRGELEQERSGARQRR